MIYFTYYYNLFSSWVRR